MLQPLKNDADEFFFYKMYIRLQIYTLDVVYMNGK